MILDKLPENILNALKICSQNADDNNLYLVGGVVRDLFLGCLTKDIDVCMEQDAIEFAKKLEKKGFLNILQIQPDLKTVKVEFSDDVVLDFATTRKEVYPKASYLPVIKEFCCDLKEDISRRDFTVNSLAISLNKNKFGEVVDFLGGVKDLENKKLKILHAKSFMDDPSRIIRALKYAVRLGFDLDYETKNLLNDYMNNFDDDICYSRIMSEIKLVFGENPNIAIQKFKEWNLQKMFGVNYFKVIQFDKKENWFLFFASVFYEFDEKQICDLCEKLNLENWQKKILNDVLRIKTFAETQGNNYKIYKKFIDKDERAINLYYALSKDLEVVKFLEELKNIKVEINGNDLIQMGLQPSEKFSEIFDLLLEKKLNYELSTKEEEIKFVKALI